MGREADQITATRVGRVAVGRSYRDAERGDRVRWDERRGGDSANPRADTWDGAARSQGLPAAEEAGGDHTSPVSERADGRRRGVAASGDPREDAATNLPAFIGISRRELSLHN